MTYDNRILENVLTLNQLLSEDLLSFAGSVFVVRKITRNQLSDLLSIFSEKRFLTRSYF